jgi:hypothetical protein
MPFTTTGSPYVQMVAEAESRVDLLLEWNASKGFRGSGCRRRGPTLRNQIATQKPGRVSLEAFIRPSSDRELVSAFRLF